VRRGACTLSDLQMQLGVAAQCGTCVSAVLDILEEEVRSQGNCSLPIAALRHAA
jgi:bacterioferritin-associated ferredoxin